MLILPIAVPKYKTLYAPVIGPERKNSSSLLAGKKRMGLNVIGHAKTRTKPIK
jgi:hypothetical protein